MRRMPVTTNQSGRLPWKIAETGIPREALLAATVTDPILLRGSTIDLIRDGGGIIVHFCLSRWTTDRFQRLRAESYDGLKRFAIEFLCPMPELGKRYQVDAVLYFNGKRPVLGITRFVSAEEIPADTIFLHNDLRPADRITEPSTRRRPLPTTPSFNRRRRRLATV